MSYCSAKKCKKMQRATCLIFVAFVGYGKRQAGVNSLGRYKLSPYPRRSVWARYPERRQRSQVSVSNAMPFPSLEHRLAGADLVRGCDAELNLKAKMVIFRSYRTRCKSRLRKIVHRQRRDALFKADTTRESNFTVEHLISQSTKSISGTSIMFLNILLEAKFLVRIYQSYRRHRQ